MGRDIVPYLEEYLTSENQIISVPAVQALGLLGSEQDSVVRGWIAKLNDRRSLDYWEMNALLRIGGQCSAYALGRMPEWAHENIPDGFNRLCDSMWTAMSEGDLERIIQALSLLAKDSASEVVRSIASEGVEQCSVALTLRREPRRTESIGLLEQMLTGKLAPFCSITGGQSEVWAIYFLVDHSSNAARAVLQRRLKVETNQEIRAVLNGALRELGEPVDEGTEESLPPAPLGYKYIFMFDHLDADRSAFLCAMDAWAEKVHER